MQLQGERLLGTDCATAWQLLNDVEVLKRCVPGCQSMTVIGEHIYAVVMSASAGPLRARLQAKVLRTDTDPPHRYCLQFDSQNTPIGSVHGRVHVELWHADASATWMRCAVTVHVSGRLGGAGSRMLESIAAAAAERFFDTLAARLTAAAQPAQVISATATGVSPRWLRALQRHLRAHRI